MPSERSKTRPSWLIPAILIGIVAGLLPFVGGANPVVGALLLVGLVSAALLLGTWPTSAIALLIIAALFTRYRFDVGPVSIRPEHISVLAVGAIALPQLLIHKARIRLPLAAWFALAWLGMNLLSGILFSPDPLIGLQNTVRLSLSVIGFILLLNLISDKERWRQAVTIFLAAGVVEALFGIIARALYPFGINLGVQVSWSFTEPIPYGTFEEGNLFGSHVASWAILLAIIILSANIWNPSRKQLKRIVAFVILLLALFLSLSRAAGLMFAAGMAIAWVFYRKDSWQQVNKGLLVLTAMPFFVVMLFLVAPMLPASWPFVDRLQSFLALSSDATFSARLSDGALALKDWQQQPLTGWGPGSFAVIHGEMRYNLAWISNISLRLLQETGILGVIAFAGFFLSLLLPALKVAGKQKDNRDRAILLGLTIGYMVLVGLAYQSTDGIWLAASWIHAALIAAGSYVLGRA